jgi:hypothetical protein
VNVSAQRITRLPEPLRSGRPVNQSFNVTGANSGTSRSGWIPAARLKSGVLATAFANPGTFDATRAARSISPNA